MKHVFWYTYILIILLSIGGLCITFQKEQVADEPIHYWQIEKFNNHNYVMQKSLTVIPGYHYIISELMLLFGIFTFDAARIITTLFLTLTLIPAFYAITQSWRKTLQLYFFPLMFIFYFLVYTDLTSLLFVVMGVMALHFRKYRMSGIFFILSMLIRQNNLVWLIFGAVYIILEECIESKSWKILNMQSLIKLFKKGWTYILGIVLFGIFIIINKGLVIGDRSSHPFGLYTTNIYYLLFLTFFMFMPSILFKLKDIVSWMKSHKIISINIIVVGIILALLNFSNTHWYNNTTYQGSILNTGILHNIILSIAVSSPLTKILFFIPVIIGIFYIIVSRLKKPIYYLIYPFSILTIIESQMVDSRYYIIPFTLFIIFREEGTEREEYYLLGYFILLALVMFLGILRHTLMW